MITKITGKLVGLSGTDATLEIGAFEYEVFVPEFVRRQMQSQIGQTISLQTIEYIDGNPQKGGKMVPRLLGFLNSVEREFFEMICSVDGVGVRKALNAMVRPVREVAEAIEEQDVKTLSALPGIGPAMAERIVAKLRRKMTKFALMIARETPAGEKSPQSDFINEGYEALVALGHSPADARDKIMKAAQAKGKVKSVEDLIQEVYRQVKGG